MCYNVYIAGAFTGDITKTKGNIMRKLNKKQKALIDTFVKNNKTAPMYLSCDVIDSSGAIENLNNYDSCWSDIERYYTDSYNKTYSYSDRTINNTLYY